MNFDMIIKGKYDASEKTVAVSVMLSDDVVITRKMSVDQFRASVAELNSTLYEIDSKDTR